MENLKDLPNQIEEGEETKILEEKNLTAKLNEFLNHHLISLPVDKLKLFDRKAIKRKRYCLPISKSRKEIRYRY